MASAWHLAAWEESVVFVTNKDNRQYDVISIQPNDERVIIKLGSPIGNTSVDTIRCLLSHFVNRDDTFTDLSLALDADDFVATLHILMGTNGLHFKGYVQSPRRVSSPELVQSVSPSCSSMTSEVTPSADSPTHLVQQSAHEQLPTYRCNEENISDPPTQFTDIVKLLRNLHPMAGKSEDRLLDSRFKQWRKQCQKLMKSETTAVFSGTYKRHISVAIMSDRCFRLACEVMEKFKKKELKEQRSNKVNQMLFVGALGVKHEEILYDALKKFLDKTFSKEEFNDHLMKVHQKAKLTGQSSQEDENVALKQENTSLKQANMLLTKENEAVKHQLESERRTVEVLREEIRKMKLNIKGVNETTTDVYEYNEDSDEENGCMVRFCEMNARLSSFEVGASVEAQFEGEWYDAKVISKEGEKLKIHWKHWSTQFDEWISASCLRPKPGASSKFQVGEKVLSKWMANRTTLYRATVRELCGDYLVLLFEDNTVKKIHAKHVYSL